MLRVTQRVVGAQSLVARGPPRLEGMQRQPGQPKRCGQLRPVRRAGGGVIGLRNVARRMRVEFLRQPLQRVLPHLQFTDLAGLGVALVGERVGLGDAGLETGRQRRRWRQASMHAGGHACLDLLPTGVTLAAHLRQLGRADRVVRLAVLLDRQLLRLQVRAQLRALHQLQLALLFSHAGTLLEPGNLGFGRQHETTQRAQVRRGRGFNSRLARPDQCRHRHRHRPLALALRHQRRIARRCPVHIAQRPRRLQGHTQRRRHRVHQEPAELRVQGLQFDAFLGHAQRRVLLRLRDHATALRQARQRRALQQSRQPGRKRVGSQGARRLRGPPQLPRQRQRLLPMHVQFGLTALDLTRVRLDLLAPLGQRLNLGGVRQHTGVDADQCQPRADLTREPQAALRVVLRRSEFHLRVGPLPRCVGRQPHHVSQLRQFGLGLLPLAQRGCDAAHPLQANPLGLDTVRPLAQGSAPRLQRLHRSARLPPVLGAHRHVFQRLLGRDQFIAGDVVRAVVRAPLRPQGIGLGSELVAHLTEAGNAGSGLEQDFADVVRRVQNRAPTGHQPAVIKAEHLVKKGPVRPRQKRRQRVVGECGTGQTKQRFPGRLGAREGQHRAVVLKRGAEPHVGLGVQEVERRAHLDPEQQIQNRPARRRLAGLVGADDQMKVLRRRRKVERLVGELAVAQQVQLLKAHGSV